MICVILFFNNSYLEFTRCYFSECVLFSIVIGTGYIDIGTDKGTGYIDDLKEKK